MSVERSPLGWGIAGGRRKQLPQGAYSRHSFFLGLLAFSFLFLSPLLLIPYVQAAPRPAWRSIGLRGETVLALAVASNEDARIIYAETHTGLKRYSATRDSGGTWKQIDEALPRDALGRPALASWRLVSGRPLQLYALTGAGTARQLYRSDDGGDTWKLIGPAPGLTDRPPMVVLPGLNGARDTITLVTGSRVQRSIDGGATWAPGGPWPSTPSPRPNPSPTGMAGAGLGRGGLKDSAPQDSAGDPAFAASRVPGGAEQSRQGEALAEAGTVPDGVQAPAAAPGQASPAVALLGDGSDPSRLYALSSGGELWLSNNGGLTWQIARPGSPASSAGGSGLKQISGWFADEGGDSEPAGTTTTLAIVPYFGIRVWAATTRGLVHGTDNGDSWTESTLPSMPYGWSLAAESRAPLACGTQAKGNRLAEGGSRSAKCEASPGHVVALLGDPRVPDTIYAGMAWGTIYRNDSPKGLRGAALEDTADVSNSNRRSPAEGETEWVSLGIPGAAGKETIGAVRVTALALDPDSRAELYAATDDGVWVRDVVAIEPAPMPTYQQVQDDEGTAASEAFASPTSTWTASPVSTSTPSATSTETPTPSATPTATSSPTATASATATRRPIRPSLTPPPTSILEVAPTATVVTSQPPSSGSDGPPPPPTPEPPSLPTPKPR